MKLSVNLMHDIFKVLKQFWSKFNYFSVFVQSYLIFLIKLYQTYPRMTEKRIDFLKRGDYLCRNHVYKYILNKYIVFCWLGIFIHILYTYPWSVSDWVPLEDKEPWLKKRVNNSSSRMGLPYYAKHVYREPWHQQISLFHLQSPHKKQ